MRFFDPRSIAATVSLIMAAVACNPESVGAPAETKEIERNETDLTGSLLVSAPAAVTRTVESIAGATALAEVDQYSYVSAPPETVQGATVRIRNRTRDRVPGVTTATEVKIVDGGFDPVPIAASAGDTVEADFRAADGSPLIIGITVVVARRPPAIVRTVPRGGKKDVPLNTRLQIVFSEPLDPATVTLENVQLTAGGVPVVGTLSYTTNFTVQFVPAGALVPSTSYDLLVRGVRNTSSIPLENEFRVSFQTAASPCGSAEQCASFDIAFSRYNRGSSESQLMASRLDGSGMIRLTSGYDFKPVWSPDGSSIAFSRWHRERAFPYELCVLSLTNGGTRCVEAELDRQASWSPDGSEIAFIGRTQADYAQATRRRLYALSAEDLELRVITDNVGTFCQAGVSWSPDGDRIAFNSRAPYRCGVVTTVKGDGSDEKEVFTPDSDTLGILQVAWSPDGQQLAVLVYLLQGACWDLCSTAIGVMNADGTGLTLRVNASWELAESVADPAWSRDGNRIFYSRVARCEGGICPAWSIESVALDGSAQSVVLLDAQEPSLRR